MCGPRLRRFTTCVAIVLFAAGTRSASAADPKSLVESFEKVQSHFRRNEFDEGRKELKRVVEAARAVPKDDPAHDVAQQILKFAPDLHANSLHNGAVAAQKQAREALAVGKPAEFAAALDRAAADLRELAALKPQDASTKEWRAAVERERAHARIVAAVATGAPVPEGLAKEAGFSPPTALHEAAPDFLLPTWETASVIRSGDFADRTVVLRVGTADDPGLLLECDLLERLAKRFGAEVLRPVLVSRDAGADLAKFAAFVAQRRPPFPVAFDDRAEFDRHFLKDGISDPTWVVVTRDRRAFAFSGRLPLESTAALLAFLEAEQQRAPGNVPRGPQPLFAPAEPIAAPRLAGREGDQGESGATIRFAARPGLLLVSNAARDTGPLLDDLAAVAGAGPDGLHVVAALYGDDPALLRTLAAGRSFPVHRLNVHPPAAYGENYVPRLVPILPGGRILKDLPVDRDPEHRRLVLAKYAALVRSPEFARADDGGRTDLAARSAGGRVVRVSSSAPPGSERFLNDGAFDEQAWKCAPGLPQDVVLSFLDGQPATFDRIRVQPRSDLAEFELLAGDDPEGPFRTLGRFRCLRSEAAQAFPVPRTTARHVVLRCLSVFDAKVARPTVALGAIAVDEAADVRPSVSDRIAVRFRAAPGFRDDFESGRAEFWEQLDFPGARERGGWDVQRGRLRASRSSRDVEPRGTVLLHAHPPVQDFVLDATVEGTTQYAGIVFGFRGWDDQDRLTFVRGGTTGGDGNSIRLERWRSGQVEVLGVHGETFPLSEPIAVQIVRSGRRLTVKLRGRVVLHRDDTEPAVGRIGLHAAGRGDFDVHDVRLRPLEPNDPVPEFAAPDLPSTAAGSSIVWINSQGDARDPRTWAANLLRVPVFAPPGAWEATRTDGAPPEIVFAFRDGAEETLTGLRCVLPPAAGSEVRNLTKQVEVLASRDASLKPERFVPVGRFELAARTDVQSFRFPQSVACRFLMLRLTENFGGDRYRLARVMFDRAASPTTPLNPTTPARDTIADAGERTQVERRFAEKAELAEREPNDRQSEAHPLPDGKTVEAVVRSGEVDLFRLPDPPSKPGRRTLRLRLEALPWLRLHAVATDEEGRALGTPLADGQAGQIGEHSWTAAPSGTVPRFVRIEVPTTSIGLVVDTSNSMTGREEDVRAVLGTYLAGATDDERLQVIRFGTTVQPLGRWPQDRAKLEQEVARLAFDGDTALFEALLAAHAENRAIVLLGDGMNTVPKIEFADLCRALRKRPVPIYAIGVGWDLHEYDARSGNTAIDLLRNLARQTGGRFDFAAEADRLAEPYHEIAAELRGGVRYRLTARWETFERTVELVRRGPEAGRSGPFSASLPAPGPELAGIGRGVARTGPVPGGTPPALLEPSPAAMPPTRGVLVAALPTGTSPVLSPEPLPRRDRFDRPHAAPLPIVPELALLRPVRPAVPVRSDLPEFAGLVVSYAPQAPGAPPLPKSLMPMFELVLDSSGSMGEKVEGKPKFEAARQVVRDLVEALPDGAQVGLRLYGHWGTWILRRTDPAAPAVANDDPRLDKDSQLVVGIGALDAERRKKLRTWIDWAQPRGKTPLVFSLLEATRDFPAEWTGPKTVVLVSDGVETCGGKLEDVARAYRDSDLGVVVHVVGFDIRETEAERQLQKIAEYGGGRYHRAGGAAELARALRSAVGGVPYVVQDAEGAEVGRGTINGDPLDLPPGDYRAVLPGIRASTRRIRLPAGSILRLSLDESGWLVEPDRVLP